MTDLRVKKTISAIRETFAAMILDMNYDKITVKSLCERANELDKYKKKIILTFIYHVGIEIYRQWISDNKKIPLEEIIDMSNKLLCRGVFVFFDIKS